MKGMTPESKKFLGDYFSSIYPKEYVESLLDVEFAGLVKPFKKYGLIEKLEIALGKTKKEF